MKAIILFVIIFGFAGQIFAQCTKDTDCKGDRICVDGKCVESSPQKPPCSRDIDCQGDSICDHGRCVASNAKSQAPSVEPVLTPGKVSAAPAPMQVSSNAPASTSVKECGQSKEEGKIQADALHRSSGWQLGGFACGLLFSFVGTGVITGIAACTSPQPDHIPSDVFEQCYKKGYTRKAKSKNVLSALSGGALGLLIGTTIASVIIFNSH
jgi:hypothetical protein